MRRDVDEAGIRRYLLGRLPEPEAEALEETYLAEAEVLERVRGVEDDLLDDYAAGRLAADEKEAFESRYLASAPLGERVAAARALHRAATGVRVVPTRAMAARKARWLAPLAVAASLLLALALWRWLPRPTELASASPPPAAARRETPPSASATPFESSPAAPTLASRSSPSTKVFVLALSPTVLLRRSDGPSEGPVALRIPEGTSTVVFEMEGVPAAVPPAARTLGADLKTVEGKPVWRGTAQRAVQPGRASLIAFAHVPATRLAPGDYLLRLSGRGGDETYYRYFFRVSP